MDRENKKEELKDAGWRKMIAYARERQYDDLIDENYVFLFGNKSIKNIQVIY